MKDEIEKLMLNHALRTGQALSFGELPTQILAALKKRLPAKYTLKTGLLWDSQDATDGYNSCRELMEREFDI